MALYEVLADSYIGGRIVKVGEEVEFDGPPHHSNLRAVDKQAQKAAAEVQAIPAAVRSLVDQARQHAATRGEDPAHADANDVMAFVAQMDAKPDASVIDAAVKVLTGAAAVA